MIQTGFEEQRPDQRSNYQTDKYPGSKEMSESTSPCRLPGYHYRQTLHLSDQQF
ncbi:hypothetical protein C8R34_101238 [Nitrosomonas sp. Nm84]|nr:hypothetical protein C8R34_101238 [Nitrosomonas sp. Nm84]